MRPWLIAVFGLVLIAPAQPAVDFSRDIEPIFHTRCYACHGSAQQMNGLRLDRKAEALKGGLTGPVIVPGDVAASKLVARVSGSTAGTQMPPAGAPLSQAEIDALREWIASGAEWPDSAARPEIADAGQSHWAFKQPELPPVPAIESQQTVANPVDRFILAKLESEGAEPSPQADKNTLVRRIYFDLTGLPPSPAEVDAFVDSDDPKVYEKTVDQLLASPHFGERWALPWLDLARYADSDGYERDPHRPHAWRWRQWVIEAINRDMPFDRFTIEQIAGDLLPGATTEQRVATGFLRNGIKNREAGVPSSEKRFEETIDRISTVSNTWLGLTVGCAQCHDHKYDPISQKEFYELFAYFNNSVERDIEAPLGGELGPYLRAYPTYRARRDRLIEENGIPALQAEWQAKIIEAMDNPGVRTDWDHSVTEWRAANDRADWLMRASPADLTEIERDKITDWFLRGGGPDFQKDEALKDRIKNTGDAITKLVDSLPERTRGYTMIERSQPVVTHIALRGDYRAPGLEVSPGTPAVLPAIRPTEKPARLQLAEWIASDRNPLTARVEVNRIWQELFGRGLVVTAENFGTQGEAPSHPELLDWLATEFVRQGWSRKSVIRLIVTSSTYRQSSQARPELVERDPENSWLARQNRLRLSAELIRDNALAVSGLLYPKIGGKSVFPPQPAGISELSYSQKTWETDAGPDRYRRGMYVFFRRTSPYPMLVNFDSPTTLVSVSRRERSNTPLQALNLLNDEVFTEAAQALAHRVTSEAGESFGERYRRLIRLALSRDPAPTERDRAQTFWNAQNARSESERQTWFQLSRAILNLDEFITRE
jgi:mono/diheme cytochrome c family protein